MNAAVRFSESNKNLFAALLKVQAETKKLVKNKSNPGTRSRYADLEAVSEAAEPVLSKHGVLLQALPISGVLAGQFSIGVYVILSHPESGEWIGTEFMMPAPVETKFWRDANKKEDTSIITFQGVTAQGSGSTLTYMRRYAIVTVLNLHAEDDDDGEADKHSRNAPPAPPLSPGDLLASYSSMATANGWSDADIKAWIAEHGGKMTGMLLPKFKAAFSAKKEIA